jgi:Bardet-Biedl syndrome 1 protein
MSAAAATTAKDGPWLHAWHDPVSNIQAHSSCVRLVDLNGDSSNILLVADNDKKMKVYKGTSIVSEHQLLEMPVSMCVFYTSRDSNGAADKGGAAMPRTPAIGIAGGSYVFIYRHLRPYFKFTLPSVPIDPQDESVWVEMTSSAVDVPTGIGMLGRARDSGVTLSSWSLDLLSLTDPDLQRALVKSKVGIPHVQQTTITCMETLKKDTDAEDAVSSLVIGTEACQVLILDSSGSKVVCEATLPSQPAILAITGLYDVEWRIVVGCRDGKIYTIKNGETRGQAVVTGTVIELETQPVSIARIDKYIYTTTMDGNLMCFHIKGRKVFSIALPAPATNLGVVRLARNRITEALIVSLANGEVRLYNHKTLVHSLQLDDVVTAMRWGQFGREANSCAFIGRNGSLTLKMMSRLADITKTEAESGPPPEQDIPLKVPKKTKLYVEQAEREVANATTMHRTFQRDLCRLRLTTAKAYVKIITNGEAGVGMGGGGKGGVGGGGGATSIRMNASVIGLGPSFKMKIELTNGGSESLERMDLCLVYNNAVYKSPRPVMPIPLLLPNVTNHFEVTLICVHPDGVADPVRVVLINPKSSVPLYSGIVTMPQSELPDE